MQSQLITELLHRIDQSLTPANALTVTSDLIANASIAELFRWALGVAEIELGEVSIEVADQMVTLSGEAVLFGEVTPIQIQITDVANEYQTKLRFPSTQSFADVAASLLHGGQQIPSFLDTFRLSSIEFPGDDALTVYTTLVEPLDLGGGKLVVENSATVQMQISELSAASQQVLVHINAPLSINGAKLELKSEFDLDDFNNATATIKPVDPQEYPTLGDLATLIIGGAIQIPDGLTLTDLQLSNFMDQNVFALTMRFNEHWSIPLGPSDLQVRNVNAALKWNDGEASGDVGGTLVVGDLPIEIFVSLGSEITIGGTLPEVEIVSLIDAIVGPILSLPTGFPTTRFSLSASDFLIKYIQESPQFLVHTPVGDFGTVWLMIAEVEGEWQAVVVYELPDDWNFSRLDPILGALDELNISKPTLTLASSTLSNLEFPAIEGADLGTISVGEGISLNSALKLQGRGLDTVSKLIGKEDLPLQLTIGDSWTDMNVLVDAGVGKLELFPPMIVFDQFVMAIETQSLSIGLQARARIQIFEEKLPELSAEWEVAERESKIKLSANEPWDNPFGIPGLTTNQLYFLMETSPILKYAVMADVQIFGQRLEMAGSITGSTISAVIGDLRGPLSLNIVVKELVGTSLNLDPLDIRVRDIQVYVVADPLGIEIMGKRYMPGLALKGTISILGLEATAGIQVDPDKGVVAEASLSEMVDIGGVFKISNVNGDGPPLFKLNTMESPLLTVSGKYSLFGIGQSTSIEVRNSGIEFELAQHLGTNHFLWKGRLNSLNDFSAGASFECRIKGTVGPIKLGDYLPSLGKIDIDTGFEGAALVAVRNDQFSGSINGKFDLQGLDLITIPEFTIEIAPNSLGEFPSIVLQQIKDSAGELFKKLFEDPGKWLNAIKENIIHGVENVAVVLSDVFEQSPEQIAEALVDSLEWGADAVADGLNSIGESLENIASVLNGLDEPIDTIASALNGIADSPAQIASALQSIDVPPIEIAGSLRNLDISAKDIGSALYQIGESPKEIVKTFVELYGRSSETVEKILAGLDQVDDTLDDIVEELSDLDVHLSDTIRGFESALGLTDGNKALANTLQRMGIEATGVADLLIPVGSQAYTYVSDLAKLMTNMGAPTEEIVRSVQGLGLSLRELTSELPRALEDLGMSAREARNRVVKGLTSAGERIEDIMDSIYVPSISGQADLLQAIGETPESIARLLTDFSSNVRPKEVLKALVSIGQPLSKATRLLDNLHKPLSEITLGMNYYLEEIGWDPDKATREIGKILKDDLGKPIDAVAQALNGIWLNNDDIEEILIDIGVAAADVGSALNALGTSALGIAKSLLEQGLNPEQIAKELANLNKAINEIAESIFSVVDFGNAGNEVAKALKSIGQAPRDLAVILNKNLRLHPNQIAESLQSIDVVPEDIAKIIHVDLEYDIHDVSKALDSIVVTADQIGEILLNTLGANPVEIADGLFRSVGLPIKQVHGLMKNLGLTDEVIQKAGIKLPTANDVSNTFTKLDPSGWRL